MRDTPPPPSGGLLRMLTHTRNDTGKGSVEPRFPECSATGELQNLCPRLDELNNLVSSIC